MLPSSVFAIDLIRATAHIDHSPSPRHRSHRHLPRRDRSQLPCRRPHHRRPYLPSSPSRPRRVSHPLPSANGAAAPVSWTPATFWSTSGNTWSHRSRRRPTPACGWTARSSTNRLGRALGWSATLSPTAVIDLSNVYWTTAASGSTPRRFWRGMSMATSR